MRTDLLSLGLEVDDDVCDGHVEAGARPGHHATLEPL
jgi:hypothetical protein